MGVDIRSYGAFYGNFTIRNLVAKHLLQSALNGAYTT